MEENYFLNYDGITGDILGFYLKSINGENIPIPNVKITPEKHNYYMENNGLYRLNPITLEDDLIPIIIQPVVKTDIELLQDQLTSTQEELNVTQDTAQQTSDDLQGLMDYLIPNN